MKQRKYKYLVGDFETTVYDNQEHTEVWASACVELFTEDVKIFNSISQQLDYLISLDTNIVIYYHNLKFDGNFWLAHLLTEKHYKQAFEQHGELENEGEWIQERYMKNDTFKYSISDKGQWYTIIIKVNGHYIEIRDSLKLLPYSVKRIGESFGTKHKKLEMEYKGFRYAGCTITEDEKTYIRNDVLVVKEALEIMFKQGHDSLTIGACCLKEYKKLMGDDYDMFFPKLDDIELDEKDYGCDNIDRYVRKSYRGGWCYVVKGKEKQIYKNGVTADVNSLYPSMMHSESGNRYPVGKPRFWKGNFIPDEAIAPNKYYFVRVRTRFYLKPNKLPFIQIKNSFLYRGTECLETTDIYSQKDDSYKPFYKDKHGNIIPARVTLTLTMTDYKLLKDHYDLVDFEILDGCYFYSEIGLFDNYIDKYKKIKMENKGAVRESAKLFLNNLYGKMASSTDSSFKIAKLKPDESITFLSVAENKKKAGYIPVGSAITSYARNFTIRTAQENYYGNNKAGFIYADTDSIHCDLAPTELKGLKIDNVNFCCWKLECEWDEAIFTRQKTYIERVVVEDGKRLEKPYYNIKCAGMPDKCKNLFEKSITGITVEELEKYTQEEQKFLTKKRTLEDFDIGLKISGKLVPKRVRGGVILKDDYYTMH